MGKIIKRKESLNKVIFILVILLITTMIPIVASADDSLDITNSGYVSYNGYEMYRNDQLIADSASGPIADLDSEPIVVGESIEVKYYWEVSKSDTITAGSYFTMDLPDAFSFENMKINLYSGTGGMVIGEIEVISGNQLKITLNENGAANLPLTGGWVKVIGELKDIDEYTTSVAFHEITIPVAIEEDDDDSEPGVDPSRSEPVDGFSGIYNEYKNPPSFSKTSSVIDSYTGTVKYTLTVNYDNYKHKYEKSSGYSPLNSVIIEDKLPQNVKYMGNLQVTIPIYSVLAEYTTSASIEGINNTQVDVTPQDPTVMSTNIIKNLVLNLREVAPANPMIDYESFKNFMKKPENVMSYGVWQDKALIINMGDIQGQLDMGCTWGELKSYVKNASKTMYYTMYNRNSTGEALNTSGSSWVASGGSLSYERIQFNGINDSVRYETLKAYAPFFGIEPDSLGVDYQLVSDDTQYDNLTGQAVGFAVSFSAEVFGESRSITNQAILSHETTSKSSVSSPQKYSQLSGGASIANPGDILLYKLDGDTNLPLEGVEFKLEKWNQLTNEYEDLQDGQNGSGIHVTDKDGIIKFEQPDYGKYRIVEVKGLDGYLEDVDIYNHNTGKWQDTFELASNTVIQVIAYNYKDNVLGEEGYSTDDEGNVLGEEADPYGVTPVLGQEAKTADIQNNLLQLLVLALLAMITILICEIYRRGSSKS